MTPVGKPESPARDCSLAELPLGVRAWVVAVGQADGERLTSHGIRPGSVVAVERDAPFRGPRIVKLGTVRIALGRSIARSILVRVIAPPGADGQ